jgi:hypothetical protein
VLSAVAEVLGLEIKPSPAHVVTGLSVGYECGALSAGMVAVSLVHGRSSPTEMTQAVFCWGLSRELRSSFEEEFGTTSCLVLERFNQKQYGSCEVCYVKGAELAVEILLQARRRKEKVGNV